VGHRGSRATHPENTIAAFEQAIRCGADAVELDVVVTTDGVLAVRHDPVNCPFAELPAGVPNLDQVLAAGAGNDIVFDIEAKACGALTPSPSDYARMIFQSVDAAGMADRVAIRSFEHEILRAAHELRPEIPLAALTERRRSGWVGMCRREGARCVSPWFGLVTKAAVHEAHAADLAVMPWTVNDPGGWTRLIEIGVRWIVTDDPARFVRYLAGPAGS